MFGLWHVLPTLQSLTTNHATSDHRRQRVGGKGGCGRRHGRGHRAGRGGLLVDAPALAAAWWPPGSPTPRSTRWRSWAAGPRRTWKNEIQRLSRRRQVAENEDDPHGAPGSSGVRPGEPLDTLDGACAHGVACVETDIRQTRDGVLVIHHNPTIGRFDIRESRFRGARGPPPRPAHPGRVHGDGGGQLPVQPGDKAGRSGPGPGDARALRPGPHHLHLVQRQDPQGTAGTGARDSTWAC